VTAPGEAPATPSPSPGPASERLAAATRRLVDAVLRADANDATLDAAADAIDGVVATLPPSDRTSWSSGRPRAHGEYLPRSPLLGRLHPAALPFTWDFHAGRFVAHGVAGPVYEGPPGYVHGGWVALMFDEALGVANVAGGHPGMTARLTIRYRRPTPLGTELRLEAWTTARQGRRISTVGTLHAGDLLCAEAEGLFVDLTPGRAVEYFGDRPSEPEPVDPLP
jgi:acyl-coenzyme A thioesterase PaaI-like protein